LFTKNCVNWICKLQTKAIT